MTSAAGTKTVIKVGDFVRVVNQSGEQVCLRWPRHTLELQPTRIHISSGDNRTFVSVDVPHVMLEGFEGMTCDQRDVSGITTVLVGRAQS